MSRGALAITLLLLGCAGRRAPAAAPPAAVTLEPAHPMAHLLIAYLEQPAGRPSEALEHYSKYLGSDNPKYAADVRSIRAQLSTDHRRPETWVTHRA